MVLRETAAVVVPRTGLLFHRATGARKLRAGFEPATVDEESITGTVPARSRSFVAVVVRGRIAESNRNGQANLGRSYR